ncbi:hypothetical protein BpHYR1_000854 [Brachionus plicatilis]|uniref:Uncharacterized protein n=1 Tax=Brachionus plicatilis TaxID=10195 RepID=A0A3M7QN91_BRAPC|nr:hypothetical protein BpHYR1_000854 [Brachionus plicatilis]
MSIVFNIVYQINSHNNIALLKLSFLSADKFRRAIFRLTSPVEYTDQILPICLPSQNYDFSNQMSWAI